MKDAPEHLNQPMTWQQKHIVLKPYPRGFHLVTREIEQAVSEIRDYRIGLAHIFIQHTSASLTINENADPDVRLDFESHMNVMVPENAPYYVHTLEGPDDMPAHIKGALMGFELTVPIKDGKLQFGTWQGIYLCEHRNRASGRKLVVTLQGETDRDEG